MVELLEPLRPHRHRAVRLLEVTGLAPIRGERTAGDTEPSRDLAMITGYAGVGTRRA